MELGTSCPWELAAGWPTTKPLPPARPDDMPMHFVLHVLLGFGRDYQGIKMILVNGTPDNDASWDKWKSQMVNWRITSNSSRLCSRRLLALADYIKHHGLVKTQALTNDDQDRLMGNITAEQVEAQFEFEEL